jgi:flagellar biosynthesis GTPase FlhF
MTTKPSLKANKAKVTKPSKVIYVPTAKHIELASQAGAAKGAELNNKEAFNKIAKELKEAKVVVGDLRTCPLAKAFITSRFTGKTSAAVKSNALSAFRKSVETGAEYSENASRDKKKAAKKTGAKHNAPKQDKESADSEEKESADEETKFTISIAKRGSAEKAAKEFRKLVNKMKESEEYCNLALLIIDAIDEFEGTEI